MVSIAQTTWNFTTCGASGYQGPSQGNCDAAYGGGVVTVNSGIQNWTVPASGTYRITATGAAGASATEGQYDGGRGARLSSEFELTAGDTLQIVVGQQGLIGDGDGDFRVGAQNGPDVPRGEEDENDGGGGGGSFVVTAADSPMVIAGGGGGTRYEAEEDGCDASASQYATTGSGNDPYFEGPRCPVKNTDLGLGGEATEWTNYGSAGAGFNGNGEDDDCGQGGRSWANGMTGGHVYEADGGFGGGGTGEGCSGGGGGGGYSGGDAGWVAGGGGSYAAGINSTALIGVSTGDGSVVIELLEGEARATFHVIKAFTDNNRSSVEVTLSCDTGLPLEQTKSSWIPIPTKTAWILWSWTTTTVNWTASLLKPRYPDTPPPTPIAVKAETGRTAVSTTTWNLSADHSCVVVNDLLTRSGSMSGRSGSTTIRNSTPSTTHGRAGTAQVSTIILVTHLSFFGCEGEICGSLSFYGADSTDSFYVYPNWQGTTYCWVDERVFESGVESTDNCGGSSYHRV